MAFGTVKNLLASATRDSLVVAPLIDRFLYTETDFEMKGGENAAGLRQNQEYTIFRNFIAADQMRLQVDLADNNWTRDTHFHPSSVSRCPRACGISFSEPRVNSPSTT